MWLRAHVLWFCEWCNRSFFGHGIRDSAWLFPFVEIFHLIGLGILGGTLLVLNLRLLGIGFRGERTSELAKDVQPWMIGSLAVMLVSGFLLFSTEAVKMYGNWAFRWKMIFLALAILYTFTIYRKVIRSDESHIGATLRALVALISLTLWAGVGLCGRAIGYVSTAPISASASTTRSQSRCRNNLGTECGQVFLPRNARRVQKPSPGPARYAEAFTIQRRASVSTHRIIKTLLPVAIAGIGCIMSHRCSGSRDWPT
jgi:hypothetical protein